METTKHTPGPWYWQRLRQRGRRKIRYAVTYNGTTDGDLMFARLADPEREADARLIAASPDLLAACRAEHASQGGPQLLRDAADDLVATLKLLGAASALRVMADQIEDAIAKAEGKAKP